MNASEALTARLQAFGIDDATVADLGATLRPPAQAGTLPSTAPPASRDLPLISVDLRGTLSGSGSYRAVLPDGGALRDLEVRSTLGEGGMGRVFMARQHSLERDVAIKTTKDSASQSARQALIEEGIVAGQLEHPGIVPVHALGVDESGRPALVMKCIEGVEWSALLADPAHAFWEDRGGDPDDRLAGHLEILMQVASAVHFANSRGVVHRDIKPQNVLIGRFGDVYLADWGVAFRMGRGDPDSALRGTPVYMAPEMVLGTGIDARTDVYLLGATLHEILVGKPPHAGKTLRDVLMDATLGRAPEYAASVPRELAALATRAMDIDAERRPATAAAFRHAIQDYLAHRSSLALARSALERLAELRRLAAGSDNDADERAHASVDRLAAETRYGLAQALEQWAGNAEARSGLAELERILDERRARNAALHRMARELDPRINSRHRVLAAFGIGAVGVALSVAGILQYRAGRSFSKSELLGQSLLPVAASAIAAVFLWRRAATTLLSRRLAVLVLAIVVGITCSRLLAIADGASVAQMLAEDCLLVAVGSVVAAATIFRYFAVIAAVMVAAAAACALVPGAALLAFSLATGGALVVSALGSWYVGRG